MSKAIYNEAVCFSYIENVPIRGIQVTKLKYPSWTKYNDTFHVIRDIQGFYYLISIDSSFGIDYSEVIDYSQVTD